MLKCDLKNKTKVLILSEEVRAEYNLIHGGALIWPNNKWAISFIPNIDRLKDINYCSTYIPTPIRAYVNMAASNDKLLLQNRSHLGILKSQPGCNTQILTADEYHALCNQSNIFNDIFKLCTDLRKDAITKYTLIPQLMALTIHSSTFNVNRYQELERKRS
jgi:hypothetical protein